MIAKCIEQLDILKWLTPKNNPICSRSCPKHNEAQIFFTEGPSRHSYHGYTGKTEKWREYKIKRNFKNEQPSFGRYFEAREGPCPTMDQTPTKTLDISALALKFNRLKNNDLFFVISVKTTQFVN
jgi:hypothetical protein